jgi:phosphoribosylpyrophosphate synthetase
MQRELARTHNVVMDGRDIGTVVLPHAQVKVYLTASAEVRAERRWKELLAKGQDVKYEDVYIDVVKRDEQDMNRKIAPLKCADDAEVLDCSYLTIDQVVAEIKAIGEVEGKDVVIVDDMIDTAGTLCKAADVLKKMGAKSVRACASHGVLSGRAVERITESALDEVYITDTIPHPELENHPKIKVLSIAPVFATIMRRVYRYEPVSTEFEIK